MANGLDNVSVIDTATNTVVATVPVGSAPFGVAVNPAGTFAYVTNDGTRLGDQYRYQHRGRDDKGYGDLRHRGQPGGHVRLCGEFWLTPFSAQHHHGHGSNRVLTRLLSAVPAT